MSDGRRYLHGPAPGMVRVDIPDEQHEVSAELQRMAQQAENDRNQTTRYAVAVVAKDEEIRSLHFELRSQGLQLQIAKTKLAAAEAKLLTAGIRLQQMAAEIERLQQLEHDGEDSLILRVQRDQEQRHEIAEREKRELMSATNLKYEAGCYVQRRGTDGPVMKVVEEIGTQVACRWDDDHGEHIEVIQALELELVAPKLTVEEPLVSEAEICDLLRRAKAQGYSLEQGSELEGWTIDELRSRLKPN